MSGEGVQQDEAQTGPKVYVTETLYRDDGYNLFIEVQQDDDLDVQSKAQARRNLVTLFKNNPKTCSHMLIYQVNLWESDLTDNYLPGYKVRMRTDEVMLEAIKQYDNETIAGLGKLKMTPIGPGCELRVKVKTKVDDVDGTESFVNFCNERVEDSNNPSSSLETFWQERRPKEGKAIHCHACGLSSTQASQNVQSID